jgi:predicted amidophosphoribosyltransferase
MEVRPWVGHEKVLITFEKFSPAKELMVYFKKGTFPSLASIFASYMTIQYTQTSLPFPDLITAVPTSMYRKLHMGYEPAKQIALEMAELLNVPFVNGFKRLSQLYRQDLLTDDKRYELSSKEFAWSFSGSLRGKRVLLIDDTVTTGATFSCCAAHLWKEGPSKIFKMACLDRGFLKE